MKKDEIRAHYNAAAGSYEDRYAGPFRRYYDVMEDKCIYGLADFTDKTVLDMGTGGGRFAFSVKRKGGARGVIGIDIAEKFIYAANASVAGNENVSFCVMDAETTAFRDSVFDTVIVPGLFEYVPDMSTYLQECSRVLKPGGELIFTCWNVDKWFAWMVFNDRMNGSVDHSLSSLEKVLAEKNFALISWVSTFFIPTRLFFGFYRRLGKRERLQGIYVNAIIALERALRKSLFRKKGGELIIKAVKIR